MRVTWVLPLLLLATPADAGLVRRAHYYGPLDVLSGVGFKDRTDEKGNWKIIANSRRIDGSGFALNVAMYRAAEMAKQQGYRYVRFLGGWASETRLTGFESATVFARPAHDPADPVEGCLSKKGRDCYTADVAHLMLLLGGEGGTQPGVAIPTGVDDRGRQVTTTGFGLAHASAVRPAAPVPMAVSRASLPLAAAPMPVRVVRAPLPTTATRAARQSAPSVAAQDVRGNSERGWTISD